MKNPTLRHLIPPRNISRPLTSVTVHDKLPCILEESAPVEAHLKNFGNGLVWTKVSTIN